MKRQDTGSIDWNEEMLRANVKTRIRAELGYSQMPKEFREMWWDILNATYDLAIWKALLPKYVTLARDSANDDPTVLDIKESDVYKRWLKWDTIKQIAE